MDTRPTMETFEDFVETALPRLVRFATWVGGPSGDPEDLVQDALERVGLKWRSISGGQAQAEAYVRRAIVNGHVSRWRSRRREHLVEAIPDRYSPTGGSADVRHGAVWQAVMSLPKGQRAVVVLRFFEELSVAETASALGLAEGTVKAQTHRALDSLRASLHVAGQAEASMAVAASAGPLFVTTAGAGREVAAAVGSRRRRRNAAVVGVATACVVAAIAVVSIGWPFGRAERMQPVIPAPSVEATTSAPSVTPATASESTPATPDSAAPTTPDSAAPGTPESASPAPAALDVAGYTFAFEDGLVDEEKDSLQRTTDTTTPWVIDPCRPTRYPIDDSRLSFAQASIFVADAGSGVSLAAYPDEATAAEVLAGFRRALEACGRLGRPRPAEGSDLTQWTLLPSPELGDEALAALSTEYIVEYGLPGIDVVAVRQGQYVQVSWFDSFYAGEPDSGSRGDGVIAKAGRELALLESRLTSLD